MKAPVKWLTDYTDFKVTTSDEIKKLASEMTLSGSKVETVDTQCSDITRVVVARCDSIKKHENSDHLMVCQMDVGAENGGVIQIVTGAPNVREGAYIPVALDNSTISGGREIRAGKLRGEESNGMMCSFEELGLDCRDYEGGIDNGVIILQDLKDFEGYKKEDFDKLIGKNIVSVLGADETVIDFEITSNRADCFSIRGLSREAAITMGGKFIDNIPKVREECKDKVSDMVTVDIQAPDLCKRYSARVVKDVKIAPSPKWMRDRLNSAGVRAINNIVDITNFVMLEYGQPMHAFDRSMIKDGGIIVRRAREGEKITTLDDVERVLSSDMLVIADMRGPVALAGVMGCANSEIEDDTKEIIFESAVFDAVTVRKGAKKLGLRTESSSRFEKGLDTVTCGLALDRAAELVELLGAGKVCKGVVEEIPQPYKERKIPFDCGRINRFLGTDIPKEEMKRILTSLECKFDKNDENVIPPCFRGDLLCDADIAEEVARFYGYNKIESTLLNSCATTPGNRTRDQKLENVIRHEFIGNGYSEMLTFSFESPSVFDKMCLPEDSPLRNYIKISNPLGEDFSVMRTSMMPSLLSTLGYNVAHRAASAALYEISYVYIKDGETTDFERSRHGDTVPEKLPEHRKLISFGRYGDSDFFSFKGDVETIFDRLKIADVEYEPCNDDPSMHPGKTAKVMVKGKQIGVFGQIHPTVAKNFGCPENTYVAFLSAKDLFDLAVILPHNKELPKFPAATRDIAIVLDKDVPAGHVESLIRQRGGRNLESCVLFDCYEGDQVPEGKKSLAYSLSFRDPQKTMVDEEVEKSMKKILNGLETEFDAKLR